MKKIVLSVAVLSAALAQAQVGINQEVPKATLDITVKKENIDNESQEGLLIPRVTKEKALKMANNTTAPEESVLIYVNDVENYASGSDVKVDDITEKGYYFWNGAKWVKSNGSDKLPWIYNMAGNVELNYPSSTFEDKYTESQHIFRDRDLVSYEGYTRPDLSVKTTNDLSNEPSVTREYTALKLSKIPNIGSVSGTNFYKNLTIIDPATPSNVKTVLSNRRTLLVDGDNTNNYYRLSETFSMAEHHGAGTVTNLIGNAALAFTFPNSTTLNSYGASGFSATFSNNNSDWVVGTEGYASQRGNGTVTNLVGLRGLSGAKEKTALGNITNAIAVRAGFLFTSDYKGQVENIKGVEVLQEDIHSGVNVTNNYGIYVDDILRGTNKYSIYTKVGKIRFGDLAGSGNRMVVADSDGKLIVGGEVTNFTSLWENTNNNSIKLKNTSTGTPRTEKNSFVITDNDLVGVGTETPRFKMHLVSSGENSYYPTALGIETYRNDPGTGAIDIIKARGTKENPEAVQNGDFGGGIHMVGHDGTSAVAMSRIATKVDGTVATGDIPSSFYFDFYRNGSYKTALKIDANGNLGLGSVNPQISFAIKSNHTGLDYVESQGLFLVNNATSDNASGIRSFGAVEISADHNANFSASTGRFEGIAFKTSGQERMRIMENGKIKASSLAGSGERIVTADADGVLKTNTTSLADLESLWKKESTSNRIVLKEDSTGATRTSTSGSRNDVTISDDGKITARGFVGYNGATIFPDYVFEKYYTGESTIKADYNFHNLESVESFIKTNGHLPGYTSAKEIAEKGLIDISATQLTNVEKIEELYLHTIEQEKAIKSQKEELKAKDAKIAELEARLSKIEQSLNK